VWIPPHRRIPNLTAASTITMSLRDTVVLMLEEARAYDAARADARTALRERLVLVAGRMLERVGADALSMRPLAKAAGCSTMVFYTEFENKEGLLDALAASAARALLEAVETVADVDPIAHRRLVAHAYLDAAFASPEHYRVLFAKPRDGAAGTPRRALVADVGRRLATALAPGETAEGRSEPFALWVALHGAALLALDAQVAPEEARDVIDASVDASARWS
jgi:AcrR family transcriptional regulator